MSGASVQPDPRSTPAIRSPSGSLVRRPSGMSNRNRTNLVKHNRFSRRVIDFGQWRRRIAVVAARSEPTSGAHMPCTAAMSSRFTEDRMELSRGSDTSKRSGRLETAVCASWQASVPTRRAGPSRLSVILRSRMEATMTVVARYN